MYKNLKLFITILICAILQVIVSCSPQVYKNVYNRNEIGYKEWIYGKVLQTINECEALVELNDSNIAYIIINNRHNQYLYDGLELRESVVFIGTHHYKTMDKVNDNDIYKTVPVYINIDSYQKGIKWDDQNHQIITPDNK